MAAPLKFNQLLDSFAGPQLKKEIAAALYASADDVRAEARRSVTAGAVSGAGHVPSKPGEPPNNDTGFLNASAETKMVNWDHAQVRFTAPYAAALEFGSSTPAQTRVRSFAGKTSSYGPSKAKQGPVRMEFGDSSVEARPFLAPATLKSEPRMKRRLRAAIQQAAARAAAGVK